MNLSQHTQSLRMGSPSSGCHTSTLTLLATALCAALLMGCSSLSPDEQAQAGFPAVARAVQPHLAQPLTWPRSEAEQRQANQQVSQALQRPLTSDSAVQIALLNNRGLQAALEQLRISQADVLQAGRLPNPGFSFGRRRQGDEREIERSLHFSLGALLSMPLRQAVEERRFAQVQAAAALQVLQLASDVRKAWVLAVSAEEGLRYTRQVMQAAQASAELARRMQQVGNFNKLQQAREQAFHADAALALARAEHQRLATRERLTRLLGLWGSQASFTLPERLPDLPASARDQPDIERLAMEQRLDVQGARLMLDETARNLGLTRRTRFVNGLDLGFKHNSSNEGPTAKGWEIGFEIPLFDFGGARVARAEAVYQQAVHRAADTAISARSEVREAYAAYRTAWDIAKHQRDEVVPLKQRISEENLLRYNGMLIGVFELLADARSQIVAVNGAIEALRDFWLAQAELDMALVGKPSLAAAAAAMSASGPGSAGAGDAQAPH